MFTSYSDRITEPYHLPVGQIYKSVYHDRHVYIHTYTFYIFLSLADHERKEKNAYIKSQQYSCVNPSWNILQLRANTTPSI